MMYSACIQKGGCVCVGGGGGGGGVIIYSVLMYMKRQTNILQGFCYSFLKHKPLSLCFCCCFYLSFVVCYLPVQSCVCALDSSNPYALLVRAVLIVLGGGGGPKNWCVVLSAEVTLCGWWDVNAYQLKLVPSAAFPCGKRSRQSLRGSSVGWGTSWRRFNFGARVMSYTLLARFDFGARVMSCTLLASVSKRPACCLSRSTGRRWGLRKKSCQTCFLAS